jgi:malonate-semialdehyde dehydrogenase (acetylating)/methylmalonate-semialdehyde dehydrogenase
MVGLNVPIPVPVAYHSFGGWKRSGFGDLNQYRLDEVRFYTWTKTVTQPWPKGAGGVVSHQSFVIPTMR